MQKSITVNRPVEELYAFWRDFRNLPQIVQFLDEVQVDGARSHWRASASPNITAEWDAEITADQPNEYIAWRSVGENGFQNAGSVQFRRAPAEWGTEVIVNLEFNPPGGVIGDAVAKVLGAVPDVLVNKALYKFKALLETGEIPTTDPQPAARNGGLDK